MDKKSGQPNPATPKLGKNLFMLSGGVYTLFKHYCFENWNFLFDLPSSRSAVTVLLYSTIFGHFLTLAPHDRNMKIGERWILKEPPYDSPESWTVTLLLTLLSSNIIASMRHKNEGVHTLWNCLQQKLDMYNLTIPKLIKWKREQSWNYSVGYCIQNYAHGDKALQTNKELRIIKLTNKINL